MRFRWRRESGYTTKVNPALVGCLLASTIFTGCAIGPGSLERDYPRYSQTLQDIRDEHMLLNIVRMRYLETPVFLQLTNITTTYSITADASASVTGNSALGTTGGGGVGGGYRETPTFTYSLPDSQEFFGRLVAKLSTAQLAPLAMVGVGGFFRMGLSRINGLENVSVYSGNTAEEPASYPEFQEALGLMEALERDSLIDFTYNISSRLASAPFDELGEYSSISEAEQAGIQFWKNSKGQWVALLARRGPFLRFSATSIDDPRAVRLRELLRLQPKKYSFPLVDVDFSLTEITRLNAGRPAAALDPKATFGEIVLVNRSMFEILGIASRSVELPDEHVQAGLAPVDEDVLGDMLTIKSSAKKPATSAAAIEYKNFWFYIADNDLESKMTLLRLHTLLEVTAGRVAGAEPILTIPVN